MKKTCITCETFTASIMHPDDWEYGRCEQTGHYAENDFSTWGPCDGGKRWKAKTPEIAEAVRVANMPLWQKLFMD